ncbi:hypothetical protein BRADI_5g10851v3 [Brachypodium distachyon]|uniref:Uncharacterized protein n=1 Tax=Brachypodium distachyon TaxID=15368 RepID=A0A2K2CGJ2_BRADI|nr:hypothetical protein BRADI_5g10851v3 [Brachypodium distachyon]
MVFGLCLRVLPNGFSSLPIFSQHMTSYGFQVTAVFVRSSEKSEENLGKIFQELTAISTEC